MPTISISQMSSANVARKVLTWISEFFESNAFKTIGNSSFLKSFSVDFSAKISMFSRMLMVAWDLVFFYLQNL